MSKKSEKEEIICAVRIRKKADPQLYRMIKNAPNMRRAFTLIQIMKAGYAYLKEHPGMAELILSESCLDGDDQDSEDTDTDGLEETAAKAEAIPENKDLSSEKHQKNTASAARKAEKSEKAEETVREKTEERSGVSDDAKPDNDPENFLNGDQGFSI